MCNIFKGSRERCKERKRSSKEYISQYKIERVAKTIYSISHCLFQLFNRQNFKKISSIERWYIRKTVSRPQKGPWIYVQSRTVDVKWQLQNILCQARLGLHMAPKQAKRRFPASCCGTAGWSPSSHPYWPSRYGLAEFRRNHHMKLLCARDIFTY